MTAHERDARERFGYECVEPSLGSLIWQLDLPDLDAALRIRLQRHLELCDACRLSLAIEKQVQTGLRDRSLRLDAPGQTAVRRGLRRPLAIVRAAVPRAPWRAVGAAGGIALAAGLAVAFLGTPVPRGDRLIERGTVAARFLRPVEGEVRLDRTFALDWAEIPGASSYRVSLRRVGGGYVWETETADTRLIIPEAQALPPGADLVATLEPVPADLAPPFGITVSFRTGRLSEFVTYRLRAISGWLRLTLWTGLVATGVGACGAWLASRRSPVVRP